MRAVQIDGVASQVFFAGVVRDAMGYPRRSIPTANSFRRRNGPEDIPDRSARFIAGHTTRAAKWIEHPTDGDLKAHPMSDELETALLIERDTLPQPQQGQLDDILATDGELSSAWLVVDAEHGSGYKAADVRPGGN